MLPNRMAALALAFAYAAGAQPLDVVFAVHAAPGTEFAADRIRADALAEGDRGALVAFARTATLVQTLTADRDALVAALQRAGVRVGAMTTQGGLGAPRILDTVDLSGAVREACAVFGPPDWPRDRESETTPLRAIVLLFSGNDPRLGANWDALRDLLQRSRVRLYAVAVPLPGSFAQPGQPAPSQPPTFPGGTATLVGRLAKESGGKMHRGGWSLKRILRLARRR